MYHWLLYGKTASLSAVDALNKTQIPTLIIHGTEDSLVKFHGSAIIGKQDRITNPKVRFLALDEEGRAGHNNILRSLEAMAYLEELRAEQRTLSERYGGDIPPEVQRELFAQVDRARVNEVNGELMAEIHNFFLSCL